MVSFSLRYGPRDDKDVISVTNPILEYLARYPIEEGIIRILKEGDVKGRNLKYQRLYDRIGWVYDPLMRLARHLAGFSQRHALLDYYERFGIEPGDQVLEVSVGTAANILLLPKYADYYGIDISLGMLNRAKRSLAKHRRDAILVNCAAESLPFPDNSFEVVFHVGGFNFFNDQQAAIDEMIRVAKPGARLLISDETEELAKKSENIPIAKWFFKSRDSVIRPPVHLLPSSVKDVHESTVANNGLYVVTFRKG